MNSIVNFCDGQTYANLLLVLAFSIRGRQILKGLDSLVLDTLFLPESLTDDPEQGNRCSPRSQENDSDGDVLEMASPSLAVSDGPSYRTSLYAILTAAPFKTMISLPLNAKGILLQHFLANDKVVKLSGNYLEELSCKLEVFPVLIPYCKLKSLHLIADWHFDAEIPEGISWPLSSPNAECLGKLPDLEELFFCGYSEVDLSAVSIPKLKVRIRDLVHVNSRNFFL